MHFCLSTFTFVSERYNDENKQLMSCSVNNILEEVINRREAGIAFCMNENEFIVLFDPVIPGGSRHLDICQEMIDCMNEYLKIPLSV